MNPKTAKEFLPLVQALSEGKTIQIECPTGWEDMVGTAEIYFRDRPSRYRIKPEGKWLRIWWRNDCAPRPCVCHLTHSDFSKANAEARVISDPHFDGWRSEWLFIPASLEN